MGTKSSPLMNGIYPWMRRRDWAEGVIRCRTRSNLRLAWVMAVIWNGFNWPLLLFLLNQPEKADMVLFSAMFCLLGVGLLLWALRSTFAWRRFGTSVLRLSSTPGVIGGRFDGCIQTRLRKTPAAAIQLTLLCMRVRRIHFRRTTRVRQDIEWQTDRAVRPERLQRGLDGLAIPVKFLIPFELPGSDDSNPNDCIEWRLLVYTELPGTDFHAEFIVPVFLTSESRDAPIPDDDEIDPSPIAAQPLYREGCWAPPLVVRPTVNGGVEYLFRIETSFLAALGASGLTGAVIALTLLLYAVLGKMRPLALLPGLLGLVLLAATLGIWTFRSKITIEGDEVQVSKAFAGISKTTRVRFSDIKEVRLAAETLDTRKRDKVWSISLWLHDGLRLDLGGSFDHKADAMRVRDEIRDLVFSSKHNRVAS